MITEILSKNNIKLKHIRALAQKKARTEAGEFVVEGFKSVQDAFYAGQKIEQVVLSQSFYKTENISFLKQEQLLLVPDEIFIGLADTVSPQGILAVLKMKENVAFALNPEHAYLYCDGVSDPGNLGTMIRTADAAGFGGVLLSSNTVDVYNPKTVRASMGSFFHIDLVCGLQAEDLLGYREQGFSLFGGCLGEDVIDYREADFRKPSVLVIGNEANGISEEVLKLCQGVKIPIAGRAESLNAAVAAGILMYELFRQRS